MYPVYSLVFFCLCLCLLNLFSVVLGMDPKVNAEAVWTNPCPKGRPLLTKRNCGPSQVMNLMFQVYGVVNGYDGLNDVGIVCNQSATVNADNALLCTGNLPFGASKFLAFSGTKNMGDMFADIEFMSVYNKYVEMRTFKGFNDKFMEWKPTIDLWFPKCDSSEKILVSGHSLGAAIAHIAGLYLAGRNCTVEIITAGEPASFLKPLSALAESILHYRFVTYASEQNELSTLYSRDPIVFLAQNFEYVHPSHSIEVPLYKENNFESYSYSNKIPPGPFASMTLWIHYNCNYQTDVDLSICKKNDPHATFATLHLSSF